MNNSLRAIDYAQSACDTLMRTYKAADLPPKGHFHYHQGVFLSGMYQTYKLCRKEKYLQYIKEWVDSIVDVNGRIDYFDPGQMDDIQPGILLYPLYERTGDSRYKKALDTLLPCLMNFPCNEAGGRWHKERHPNQMWLDGLYMGGPIGAEYAYRFKKPDYLDITINQILLMQQYTKDPGTGLWYHAWDSSKKESWANPLTGLSPEFWGRSIGWVPVAVLDILDYVPHEHPQYIQLRKLIEDLLKAVCMYQSDDGRWYQVVDKGGQEGNWLENSCSCLFVAAVSQAVRKGILGREYASMARKGYQGVIQDLTWEGDDLLIGNVCVGTGVGDYYHYCHRPVCTNDLHGVGAFLLMCGEIQKLTDEC